MKRICLAAALALSASACAPATHDNINLAANTNATPAATPSTQTTDAEIISLERQVWDALKSKNLEAFSAQLTDDHLYVTNDGIYDRSQLLENLKKINFEEVSLEEFRVVRIGNDVAVVTYTANTKGGFDGQPFPGRPERNSTAWVRRNGRWLAAWHQDTYAAEATANRPAETGANTSASPAGASATPVTIPTTAPANSNASPGTADINDVVALERQVWDALRRRDYDAFAAMLSEEAIEVEPTGVYTKRETVEGIKNFDFSNAAPTDFKQLKLGSDVVLITYIISGNQETFGPHGMRHTTIWHARPSRPLAVFHHGTQITR